MIPILCRRSPEVADLKVLDLSTFWSGAYLTMYLGAFGADVVKVESIQRPDGLRSSGVPQQGDWYDRSAGVAGHQPRQARRHPRPRDRTRPRTRLLIREADIVVENFSPRVVEQFGLEYESLRGAQPDVIMVRMPGFGLEGPWRDYVGWALNIEQASGMAAVTGYADGPPCNLPGPADPVIGMHAAVALQAALEHPRRTGEGELIEVAQLEDVAWLRPSR